MSWTPTRAAIIESQRRKEEMGRLEMGDEEKGLIPGKRYTLINMLGSMLTITGRDWVFYEDKEEQCEFINETRVPSEGPFETWPEGVCSIKFESANVDVAGNDVLLNEFGHGYPDAYEKGTPEYEERIAVLKGKEATRLAV